MKIALCVHVFDQIDFDVYFNHLFCAAKWCQKYEFIFIGKKGLDAATARNLVVDKALGEGCTHALILDGDHLIRKPLDFGWSRQQEESED